MVQHEDDLRNQRLGYLLTLNGLLFAGLAFSWRTPNARSLVAVLAVMGILIAASSFASMLLSDDAIRYLRSRVPIFANLGRDASPPVPEEGASASVTQQEEVLTIPVAISRSLIRVKKRAQPESRDWAGRTAVDRVLQPWRAFPVILGGAWIAILFLANHHLHW